MRKYASVDFGKCTPAICHDTRGVCPALAACPRHLLEQEGPEDPPLLIATSYCTGCGSCVAACPALAVTVVRGL